MCVVAGLVGVPGRIAICEGGESAIFRLGAHGDGSGNPCVPHRSIRLSVRFFIRSKAGLAVTALTGMACDRQVAKFFSPLRIPTVKMSSSAESEFSSEMSLRDKHFKNSSRACRFVVPTVGGGGPMGW